MLLFFFSKCPLLLIKVDFDWEFAINKYAKRAYLHTLIPYNLQYLMTTIQSRVRNRQGSFHIKNQESDFDVPFFLLPIVP
jgi:hypothetical protein